MTIPAQLWASETGGDGVEPKTIALVDAALKAPHTFTRVERAQHFAFFSVCPASIADQEPVICKDPPRFDRAQFHNQLNGALVTFFRANL